MTGWSVMLRGIRHRSGRSLVVLLLAAFAVLACILVPAYGRAAAQSVLTDAMRAAPQTATALTISAESSAAGSQGGAFDPAQQSVAEAKVFVDGALAKAPSLAGVVDRPITSVESDVRVADHAALLTWRLGACERLQITAGQCAIDAEQAVVSERSAAMVGLKVGDRITLAGNKSVQVTGLYVPRDPSSVYWGNSAYFAHAPGSRLDAVFAGSEEDVRSGTTSAITAKLTFPLKPDEVRLDAMAGLRSELGALGLALNAVELKLETALLAIADEVAKDQAALAASVPMIAIPLLLLAFVVLFLIVATLAEDRAPELALARLRGFPGSRAARFGLSETLLLITLGAPLGLVGGLALTELAARTLLAPGTHVEPRWPVFVAAAAGLGFAYAAAWLATRRINGRGVLTLLRRVPQRATAKSGVVEAIVGTLAVVGLVAAIQDRGGTVKLLAPAAIALLAGLVAGRLLTGWARVRLAIARRRGHLPGILAAAQLARRPGAARMAVVLTSAVALLAFAAASWDVAARAREQHADDVLGAAGVYQVTAAHPQALMAAVSAADPSGGTMAVVRADEQYAQGRVELIGVQSERLGDVAIWRGKDRADLAGLGERLREGAGKPVLLGADVSVRLSASGLGEVPLRLGAMVSAPGQPPVVVWLGPLAAGGHDYAAPLRACSGCRFVGLAVGRVGGLTGAIRATLALQEVRTGTTKLPIEAGTWRTSSDRNPSARVTVADGTLTVESSGPGDVIVSHVDTPSRLPAVLAGAAPGEGDGFTFPGFADVQQEFAVVERAEVLPRAGAHGLLFDLDLAVRSASVSAGLGESSDLRYEVWTNGAAAAGLDRRLAEHGVGLIRYQTKESVIEQLSRRAPALGFSLYLLAGIAAAALGLGVLALSRRLGAADRRAELNALRATGVRSRVLRRALRRERSVGLALPLIIGVGAGVGAAVLMLPGIPLVVAGATSPVADLWRVALEPSALTIAAAAALLVALTGWLTAGRQARGGVQ